MAAEPVFEPAIDAKSLEKVGPGQLVRFASQGNVDEHAFTALVGDERRLIALDSINQDGRPFTPYILSEATVVQPVVILLPTWRIEPMEVVATGASSQRRDGVILISETGSKLLLLSGDLGFGRSQRIAVNLQTGIALDQNAYGELRSSARYVAVTRWNLRVPHFNDDGHISWRPILQFGVGAPKASP